MAKLLILLVVFLAAFLALGIWLYNAFGIWGFLSALALFVVGLYSLKFVFGWLIKRLFLMPFKAKGAVLMDAELTVHSIVTADAPPPTTYDESEDDGDDDDEQDEDDVEDEDEEESYGDEEPQDWYFIEATITPKPSTGNFRHWEPGDLVLVAPETKGDDMDADDRGSVADIQIWHDGRWQPDEGGKYEGPLRVKLRVGVQRGTRKARFKYYFEVFGDALDFPAAIDV